MNKIGVLLAGGGTAGHIYPLISVASKLPEGIDLRYFGSPGDFADEITKSGIKITKIASSKLRRYGSVKNFFDVFKFFWGLGQALWKVFLFMPNIVFSKGGPGALPVILAARFYRIPVVIHESDSIPGRTSLISGRMAKIIELGFAGAEEHFKKTKAKFNVVGNPVREVILSRIDQSQAKKLFELADSLPTLLFIGGSQGSSAINDFVLTNAESLLEKFQIIHQVGGNNYEEYAASYELLNKNFSEILKKRYKFYPYLGDNVSEALDAADIVISRAGGSVFELAAKGKPAILIPLRADVVGEHQIKNAYTYSDSGAAVVIEENNLLFSVFESQVHEILNDPKRKEDMIKAARGFARVNAAEVIANDIMSLI